MTNPDYKKMINDGWKIYPLNKPSTNSYKVCLAILKTGAIEPVDWVPFDQYKRGKFEYTINRGDASTANKRESGIDSEVVLWKPIQDFILREEQ